jgi:hypothetical protein
MSLSQRNASLSTELLAHPHVVLVPLSGRGGLAAAPCATRSLSMRQQVDEYQRRALQRVEALLAGVDFVAQLWRHGLVVGSGDARILTLLDAEDTRLYDAESRVFLVQL